jgi:predicted Zn-dependent peptidase
LTIIGGVQPNRAMRALRQLLGVWRKTEQLVPATFRQPSAPDTRTLIVNAPTDQSAEVRLAMRGFSRKDADSPAAAMLAVIARHRWERISPQLARNPIYVRHDAFVLPGMFVMGATVDTLLAAKTLASAKEIMQGLATTPVAAAEFETAKAETLTQVNSDLAKTEGIANAWLDSDTYGLPSMAERIRALNAITATDLQRVAARLMREGAFVSVVVGNSEVLKAQLEHNGKVEVMGEIAPKNESKSETKSNSNLKPPTKSPAKPE